MYIMSTLNCRPRLSSLKHINSVGRWRTNTLFVKGKAVPNVMIYLSWEVGLLLYSIVPNPIPFTQNIRPISRHQAVA